MLESPSSCNEDYNYKRSSKKCISRLSSKNRNFLFSYSNRSSEPNCESDSEGVLTSRAIEKLTLYDGNKRSVESDYGAPQHNTSKKFVRRRQKPKNLMPMQIDNELLISNTLKSCRREKRSLGKRKRYTNGIMYSNKLHPSYLNNIEIDKTSHSDCESIESFISGKTTDAYLSEEDTARDGDDEQSDWYQDLGLSSGVVPLYEISISAFFDKLQTPRNSDDITFVKSKSRTLPRDEFPKISNFFNKQSYRRSIKTGNRRLLDRNMENNSCSISGITNSQQISLKSSNRSFTDRHRKFSNKRLRCGSSSVNSFCESTSRMDSVNCHVVSGNSTTKCQHNGRPPFKKGATEKQILGKTE